MSRPAAKPALKKAPKRVHPIAPEPSPRSQSKAVTAEAAEEVRVMHSARIRAELRKDLKRHAIDAGLTLEEITEAALESWLAAERLQARK